MSTNLFDAMEIAVKNTIHKKYTIDLEKDLTPDNPNLVRPPRVRRPKLSNIITSDKPIPYEFSGEVNPFADAKHFIRYYHAFLQQCTGGKIEFDSWEVDSLYATQILDLLIEHQRDSNKIFLNSWLRYFYEQHLKGNKANKIKYTSLKVFKETFDKFNVRYVEVSLKSV